ncbi:MAG TPA: hypothetical protein VHX37_07150 [Acidobacteriaceae bacterium]|jgi:hypothetical protein|nr:hypothetical protein [Acidobacteriaceae bacterium]
MPDLTRKEKPPAAEPVQAVDAIRDVGPTLETEGTFLPTGELPENRIENQGLTDVADMRTVDEYDRKAEAMGAEMLRTRLPGDTSSDPHTDTESEDTTQKRGGSGKNRAA